MDIFSRPALDLESCLAECRRILKPGGVLVFRVPIAPPLWSSMQLTDGLDMDVRSFCRLIRESSTDAAHATPSPVKTLEDLRLSLEHDGEQCTATLIVPG